MQTARGKDFLEQQNFCGWGKRLVVYYAYALIKTGNLVEAKKQLRSATAMVPGIDDALDKELLKIVEAYAEVAEGNVKGGVAKMDDLVEKMRAEVKPFLYNLQADLLVADGKQQEAVITYYKVLLLDKTNPWQREYAKSKISEIYKQTNDPRAELVKKIN
jgi:predicted negative regulator of RcsB-dependent stress response